MTYYILIVFPEDKDITICPSIGSFSDTGSTQFNLEPTSVNNRFLVGNYIIKSDSGIQGAQFNRENGPCEDNPVFTCSKLTLVYSLNVPVGRGTFPVTYAAANGVTRNIHINFGEFESFSHSDVVI